MNVQTLQTSSSPVVCVKAGGDLKVKGSVQSTVQLRSDDGPGKLLADSSGEIRVVCPGDGELSVPAETRLTIVRASGDVEVDGLIGMLTIQTVGCDLSLKNVCGLDLQTVGGDLLLEHLTGDAHVTRVGGDVMGEDVQGLLDVDLVGGDVVVNGLNGCCTTSVGGDLILRMTANQICKVRAGGDIILHVPEHINANLNVKSGGHDIQLLLGANFENLSQSRLDRVLGKGGVEISLMAGGDVRVTDAPWQETAKDASSLKRSIQFMNDEIRGMTHKTGVEHSPDLGNVESVGEDEPIPQPSPSLTQTETAPTPEEDADARLMILRMLQNKKINAEEAERLLEALDGEISQE